MEPKENTDSTVCALRSAVRSINPKCVRSVLDSLGVGDLRKEIIKDNSDLIHLLLLEDSSDLSDDNEVNKNRIMILYMLIDAGANVNHMKLLQSDENHDYVTPLWLAMKSGNVAIAQVLLQCGADTNHIYRNKTLWDWVVVDLSNGKETNYNTETTLTPVRCSCWCLKADDLENLFLQYGKGLGPAIQEMQLESIRVSINFCCRTDITIGDRNLIDIVVESGNDDIRKLITRATPYLKLAHHILAQDIEAIRIWYESNQANPQPIIPLFYFGPYENVSGNVPLIHFAIQYNNVELIRLLLSKGHRVTARVSYEDTGDMPVFFSALQPNMPVEGVRIMLENLHDCEEKLHRLFWLDCNVLHVALRNRCSLDIIQLLLDFGGPHLLCQRNASNQTARDMAESMKMSGYIEVIDQTVTHWLTYDETDANIHRPILAIYSYDLTNIFENESIDQMKLQDYKSEFYQLQEQLEDLYNAVMENDVKKTRTLLYFDCPIIGRHHLPLECRLAGDGLPLLHIAVLRKFEDLVTLMLEDVEGSHNLNAITDQFGRTALHYAYASADSSNIIRALIHAGSTEAVFDMNGRRPEDYKEMQGTPEMEHLLQCLRIQDYSSPLMDPLEPNLVSHRRKLQWEWRVEAYRKNKSSFTGCRGTSLQNGSHFRHPLNNQPIWCNML